MKIIIKQGSIINEIVDAIINPANSYGYMGGGVAKAIKDVGGENIEKEAILKSPTLIGNVCITTAGDLPAGFIIHAPVMHEPAEKIDSHKVRDALIAALDAAENEGYHKLAIPGMGTGIGGVPFEEVARTMMKVIKAFDFRNVHEIILRDINEEMIKAWKKFV